MHSSIKIAFAVCAAAVLPLLGARANTVTVKVGAGGLKFNPATVTINVGDTVHWTWSSNDHSTTSGTPNHPDGMWDSGVQNAGFTFDFTFNTAGTFNYYCTVHGQCCGMVGSVIVNGQSDTVTITKAQYTSTTQQLTVAATDTNTTATLTCSVTSTGVVLGTLQSKGNGTYQGKFNGIATNPMNITVTSNLGGSDSARVKAR